MAIRFTIFARDDASSPSTLDFDMEKVVVGRGARASKAPLVSWLNALEAIRAGGCGITSPPGA